MSEQWFQFEFYLKSVKLIFHEPSVSIEMKVGDQQYTLISKLSPNQKGQQYINEKIVFDVLISKNQNSQWVQQMLKLDFLCQDNIIGQCSLNLTSYITQQTRGVVENLEIEPNLAIKYQITIQLLDENDSQKHMSDSNLKLLTETWQSNQNQISLTKQHISQTSIKKKPLSQQVKLQGHKNKKESVSGNPMVGNSMKQSDFVQNYKGAYGKKNYEEQKHQSSEDHSRQVITESNTKGDQDPIALVVSRLQREPFLDVVQSTNMHVVMKQLQNDKHELKNQLVDLKNSNQVLQIKVDSLEVDLIDLKNLTEQIINSPQENHQISQQHSNIDQSDGNQQIIQQLKSQLNLLVQELERTKITQSREKELVKYIEDQKITIQKLKKNQSKCSDYSNQSTQTHLSGENIDSMIDEIKSRDQQAKAQFKTLDIKEKEIKNLFLQYQNSLNSLVGENKSTQCEQLDNDPITNHNNTSNNDQIEILETQLEDYEYQLEAYKQENKQLKAESNIFKQEVEKRKQNEKKERSMLEADMCITKQRFGDVLNLCFQSGYGDLIDQINSCVQT